MWSAAAHWCGTVCLPRCLKPHIEDHGQRIDSFMASEHGLLDGIVLDYGKRLLAAR